VPFRPRPADLSLSCVCARVCVYAGASHPSRSPVQLAAATAAASLARERCAPQPPPLPHPAPCPPPPARPDSHPRWLLMSPLSGPWPRWSSDPRRCLRRPEWGAVGRERPPSIPTEQLLLLLWAAAAAAARWWAEQQVGRPSCACIGSPFLRHCVHGASIGSAPGVRSAGPAATAAAASAAGAAQPMWWPAIRSAAEPSGGAHTPSHTP
jgi:hypothetical protein